MSGENNWPLPKFFFTVDFGDGTAVPFQEVTGLESESQTIEYRHGNSPPAYPIKMPGQGKIGHVMLHKGVLPPKHAAWLEAVATRPAARHNILIRLMDESGRAAVSWTLNNAWPTKVTTTTLESEGNEIAIESLEIAFEGMVVSSP